MNEIIEMLVNNTNGQYNGMIKVALAMTVIATILFYSSVGVNVKRNNQAKHSHNVPKQNKVNDEVKVTKEEQNVDTMVIKAVDMDVASEYNRLRGLKTSTGLNAYDIAQDIANLIYHSGDVVEASLDKERNIVLGGNGYHIEGHNVEVVLESANGRSFYMTTSQLNHVSSVRDLNGVINDDLILSRNAFNKYF